MTLKGPSGIKYSAYDFTPFCLKTYSCILCNNALQTNNDQNCKTQFVTVLYDIITTFCNNNTKCQFCSGVEKTSFSYFSHHASSRGVQGD